MRKTLYATYTSYYGISFKNLVTYASLTQGNYMVDAIFSIIPSKSCVVDETTQKNHCVVGARFFCRR